MNLNKVGLHAPYMLQFDFGPNATITSIAYPVDDYYEVVEVREVHTIAGNDAGSVTAIIEKLTGTQAPGAGANMFKTSTINLKGTANTVQTIKSSQLTALSVAQKAATQVAPGDRIGFTTTGNLATLAGVCVVVVLRRTRIAAASAR